MGWTPGPGATSGADTYVGDGTDEVVDGLGGNDTLSGGGGADTITGGLGVDTVNGDAGNDVLIVNEADATGVADQYNGGADTDTLRVIGTSLGQQNFDFWAPSFSSIERLEFASVTGTETRLNFQVNDFGAALSLNLAIVGSALVDNIFIRNVDDNVAVNFNASGFTFTNWSSNDGIHFTLGHAADNVTGSSQNDEINTYEGNDTLVGGDGNDSLYSGIDNDFIDGGNGNDDTYGDAGNDVIYGRAGNDFLNGGAGIDTMYGGDGDDIYFVHDVGDVTIENGPTGGYDTIIAYVTRTLGAGFEQLYLNGTDPINGTGNELANYMVGNDAANILNGKAGADTVSAAGGDDTVYGGDGNDSVNGGVGADFLDGGNNDDYLSGDNDADTIYGRAGNDTLIGGDGVDTMYGGAGDDLYYVSDAGDAAIESSNSGTDTVYSYLTSYSLGAYIENLYLSGSATTGAGNVLDNFLSGTNSDNTLYGNGDDYLQGEAGDDTLYGRNNNDRLDGGLGADTLYGGNDADTYVFSTALGGGNIDTIGGFSVADDTIELRHEIFTAAGSIGVLDADAFVIGSAAADAEDRIIYDSTTGALYYDDDGTGGDAAVQFATLTSGLALTNNDFLIG